MTIENFGDAIDWALTTGDPAYGPGFNSQEITARYDQEDGSTLTEKLQSLKQEAMRMEVDWTKYDLAGAQAYVARKILDNRPELSPQAAEWVGRYFSFQNR